MSDTQMNNLINGVAANYLNSDDRAIHYGDGLFETILCQSNRLYYWQKHFLRLQAGAKKLGLNCPTENVLLNDIKKLLNSNESADDKSYAIKIILTRGIGRRGYAIDKQMAGSRLVSLSVMDKNYSSLLSGQLLSGDLFLCKQQVSINESLAGLKHLNRLENVLARNEWTDARYIDGLMLNARQHIIEGSMSNVFAVKDNTLFIPDITSSGVAGIMREVVIEVAKTNNIETVIKDIKLAELKTMDEIFITNSLIMLKSIVEFDEIKFDNKMMTTAIYNYMLNTVGDYVQTV